MLISGEDGQAKERNMHPAHNSYEDCASVKGLGFRLHAGFGQLGFYGCRIELKSDGLTPTPQSIASFEKLGH